jgi:hypothetical protein
MKKILIAFVLIAGAGAYLNFSSYAGCETSLPNNLQSCFNAVQLHALTVTVSGGNLFISGTMDPSKRDECQACIDDYLAGAASCPGAPVIVYAGPPTYGSNGTAETHPTTTGHR